MADYETKISALEREIGQLTMEIEFVKKASRPRLFNDSENVSIVTEAEAALRLPEWTSHRARKNEVELASRRAWKFERMSVAGLQ